MQPTLDLDERIGHALLVRAVVDRRAVPGLGELVVETLGQFRQRVHSAAQLVGTAIVVVVVIVGLLASSLRRGHHSDPRRDPR
jgi:ABC-type enterochelin transport system permease subunit